MSKNIRIVLLWMMVILAVMCVQQPAKAEYEERYCNSCKAYETFNSCSTPVGVEPVDELTHLTKYAYALYCIKCDYTIFIQTSTGKTGYTLEQEHQFVDGLCWCGYVDPSYCDHSWDNNGYDIKVLYQDAATCTLVITYYYLCELCGESLSSTPHPEGVNGPHDFDNGICICGYQKDGGACQHTNKTGYYDPTIPPIFSNITPTHHNVLNGYKMICDHCGIETGETGHFKAITEAHSFNNGKCALCGYQNSSCSHAATKKEYLRSEYEQIAGNDQQHRVIDHNRVVCADCGQVLNNDQIDYWANKHSFNKNNQCTACGYQNAACNHVYSYDYADVSDGEWQSINDDYHKRVTVLYKDVCTLCGDVRYQRRADVATVQEKHTWGQTNWAAYGHDENAHWRSGKCPCTAPGCNYTKNVVELRTAHTFVNGKCVCGAKTKSCQHEMVKQEPNQVITQYDSADWMHVEFHRVEMITYEICKKCGYQVKCEEQELPTPKSHEFEGGECKHCGYSKTEDYFALLSSLPKGANPMENETLCEILYGELYAAGMSRNEIEEIFKIVEKAPATYRDLYLYSFFDYKAVRNWTPPANDPNAASHFSPSDNALYINKNTVDSSELVQSTWFHEVGHAIDYDAEDRDYLSRNNELFEIMQNDVAEFIEIVIDEFPLGKLLNAEEREKIVKTILGSDRGYPEWNDNTQEWDVDPVVIENSWTIYVCDQVMSWMDALAREKEMTNENRNAYMVTDCLNGLTDNAIKKSASFTADVYIISHGTIGKVSSHPDGYWYDESGQPIMIQCMEAWAEFFTAKITQNKDAIQSNQLYFPKTCAYFEKMAKEMLDYYKDKAGAK